MKITKKKKIKEPEEDSILEARRQMGKWQQTLDVKKLTSWQPWGIRSNQIKKAELSKGLAIGGTKHL